jgi:IclR family transcriptional regulator, acetate operon repressor
MRRITPIVKVAACRVVPHIGCRILYSGLAADTVESSAAACDAQEVDVASNEHAAVVDGDGGSRRPTGTQAVDRALAILGVYSPTRGEFGISELSRELGLTPSTVHRIVRALVSKGFLSQDPDTERYRLGPAAMVLGQVAQQHLGLLNVRDLLDDLGRETGESVNLGVLDRSSVVVLIRVASPQPLRFDQSPGERLPAHATSMGKALLAFSADPGREIARLFEGGIGELPRYTDTTVTSRDALRAEIEAVRERGYSIDEEESIAGVRCIGVPVLGADGRARAAIAVQAPTVRMPDDRLDALVPRVIEAARQVAEKIHLGEPALT